MGEEGAPGASEQWQTQRLGTGHAGEPPVVRLANDIARQFAHLPEDEAAAAIAQHMTQFWEPRMRARLSDEVADDPDRLDPLVLAALATSA